MVIMEMTLALVCLTVGLGCMLWMLVLYFEEIHPAAECEGSPPKGRVLLSVTVAGLIIIGALAVLVVEAQQLLTPAFL